MHLRAGIWELLTKKEIIMTPTEYLKTAQKSGTRRKKVEWLFTYFNSVHIKKTYNTMIEYVGFTGEQIDLEIEEYLERELTLEKGL